MGNCGGFGRGLRQAASQQSGAVVQRVPSVDTYGITDEYERVRATVPSASQLMSIAGKYSSPEIDNREVTVAPSGNSISVQLGTKMTLILTLSYDNDFSNDLATVIFSRDENG
jgi:hypothetical protein